jgi:hypothetical protein
LSLPKISSDKNLIRPGANAQMGSPRTGMIDLLNLLGGWLVGLFRSPVAREAELAFLRQQLLLLKRSAPARLRPRTADRLKFNNRHECCILVQDDEGPAEVIFRLWHGGTPSSGCSDDGAISSSPAHSIFNVCRHLTTASTHRILRGEAFAAWNTAVAASA